MRVLHRLWADDAGFVVSTELVLVATVLVIGLIVGLTELRNQVVQELADVAMAIGNINQSYYYDGIAKQNVGETAGSMFHDYEDWCQVADGEDDEPGDAPADISIRVAPKDECDDATTLPGW
jgi:hypothetical protein